MCSTARGLRFEYSSQSDFLHRLHGSGALQDEVLGGWNPGFVKFMNMGDFREPHIGYVDPTLSSPQVANPPASLDRSS